jgi:hypothetical protein
MGVLLDVMGFARCATGKASPAAGRTFAPSGGSNIPEGGRRKLCGMTGYSRRGKRKLIAEGGEVPLRAWTLLKRSGSKLGGSRYNY